MGFLGLGNYSKPGKGVKKGESDKKRFFQFFDLISRKVTKLIQLNLLFLLFSLPAILLGVGGVFLLGITLPNLPQYEQLFGTLSLLIIALSLGLTGPAFAAMVKVTRYYNDEKPVFLWSDFITAYKSNFKQSLAMGMINGVVGYIFVQACLFYFGQTFLGGWVFWLLLGLVLSLGLVMLFANFYTFLVIVSVELPLRQIIKNSISFAFLGLKTNFITGAIIVGTSIVMWTLFTNGLALLLLLGMVLAVVVLFSFCAMLITFNSFQYVYRFSIRPYYVLNNLADPYEDGEDVEVSIFTDAT